MITEEGFVDFKCPYCGHLVSFPQSSVGRLHECISCLESLIVPEAGSEVGRRIPVPITTPRLVLRRLKMDDWRDLVEFFWDDEKEVTDWINYNDPVKLTTPDRWFNLGIEVQSTSKVVGYLSLNLAKYHRREAVVAICVSKQLSDDSLAIEAIAALFAFCFNELRLHRVVASHDSREQPTIRLFEQAGMRREGESIKDHEADGEWFNTVWLAILEVEYHQGKNSAPPKGAF